VPPTTLRAGTRRLELSPDQPVLMGVVNASPESFSDGGVYATLDRQVARAEELVAAGAGIIDVGGESGVTGMAPISPEEEIHRVGPLVERLVAAGMTVSVDTWKPAVARAVVAAGAHIVNDVSGLRDPALADACADSGAALVLMHTRAEPKHKDFPPYDDVTADVVGFLRERMALAMEHGVALDQIVLDPGPDFAKTPAETVEVLRAIDRLHALGHPLLLAVSRKYFLGAITGRAPAERVAATLAAVGWAADHGAAIVRVHEVAAADDFLRVRRVLGGAEAMPAFDADDDALKWIRARG
jgi:dihydropteroate synthase